MAKVTDQSFDHDYDGIKEYDNPLPRWWVWLFIGSVIWAVVYIPYYHFGPGLLPEEFYEEDMAAWLLAHPPEPLPDEQALIAMASDPALVSTGQSIFAARCATCHGPDGGGLVGPNLTDDYTLHGYSRAAITKVIHDGVPENGMLAWKNQLSRDEIYGAALYVYSLRGTTPAKPKPPQGDPIVDEEEATPAAGKDEAAAGEKADAPAEEKVEAPTDEKMEAPAEGSAEAPAEGSAEAPAEGSADTAEAPAEAEPAEAPAGAEPSEGATP